MSHRMLAVAFVALVLAALAMSTGCNTVYGPHLGLFATPPIPVSPYFQQKLEERAIEHERYDRVPVLGPIPAGAPCVAMDPPSDDEVMRALERAQPVEGGTPFLWTQQRNNVRIVVEPIADYVDPPRVYPLIGPAQLHHAHYKCIIYYTKTTRVGWPIPYTDTDQEAQEVIYIDHNHFHMVGNVDTGPGAQF